MLPRLEEAAFAPTPGNPRDTLHARGIAVVDGLVTGLSVVSDRLDAVQPADGRSIPRAALFMRPTLRPRDGGLIETLGCATDNAGFVRVDGSSLCCGGACWWRLTR